MNGWRLTDKTTLKGVNWAGAVILVQDGRRAAIPALALESCLQPSNKSRRRHVPATTVMPASWQAVPGALWCHRRSLMVGVSAETPPLRETRVSKICRYIHSDRPRKSLIRRGLQITDLSEEIVDLTYDS